MKSIVTLIVLILCTAASGQSFDAAIEHLQATKDAQRDELVATREQLRQANAKAADAIEANIQQNAAFKDQIDAREKVIKKQAKTLGKWYVKAVLILASIITWVVSIGALLYVLAFIGGICRPGTALFELSGKLISFLPWANIVESGISLFHKTTTVRAIETPIVQPPAVVERPPLDPALAANLAALVEANSPPPPVPADRVGVDFKSNLGWDQVKPSR